MGWLPRPETTMAGQACERRGFYSSAALAAVKAGDAW
jgi:hypothetical protein